MKVGYQSRSDDDTRPSGTVVKLFSRVLLLLSFHNSVAIADATKQHRRRPTHPLVAADAVVSGSQIGIRTIQTVPLTKSLQAHSSARVAATIKIPRGGATQNTISSKSSKPSRATTAKTLTVSEEDDDDDATTSTAASDSTKTAEATTVPKKKKKKRKSIPTVTSTTDDEIKKKTASAKTSATLSSAASSDQKRRKEEKKKTEQVLQEDTSTLLGNAIRDRAEDLLLSSGPRSGGGRENPLLDQIDQVVTSVGWGLGASDRLASLMRGAAASKQSEDDDDNNEEYSSTLRDATGGVEASTTAVLVHYFMKSHGGAHAVQCVCSLLATLTGFGAVVSPYLIVQPKKDGTSLSSCPVSQVTLLLMRRCLTFAMMKHLSGMLAASVVAARAIPEVGLRKARVWIHNLAQDPISQYVFYTACVLFWLPGGSGGPPASSSNTNYPPHRWWQVFDVMPLILVGPVLVREWINTLFVISDVLVLWLCTNQTDQSKGELSATIQRILRVWRNAVNAFMSILVTPHVWRSAVAAQRQAILAKLTGRISLLLELLVGLIMAVDVIVLVSSSLYRPAGLRPPLETLLKTAICAPLYWQFLWGRRRKLSKLATKVRSGASQFPLYVLDVLLDPIAAMGLKRSTASSGERNNQKQTSFSQQQQGTPSKEASSESKKKMSWTDWIVIGLGLDDDNIAP